MGGQILLRQGDVPSHTWLRRFVLELDEHLRRSAHVFEYSESADCLFRIRIGQSPETFTLSDGVEIGRGDPIVDLHLWNEHIPPIERRDGAMAWASRVDRAVTHSLRELIAYLDGHREFDRIQVVCADMGLGTADRTGRLLNLCRKVGLERVAVWRHVTPVEHVNRAGQNMLGLLLTLAVNPRAARPAVLARDRALVAISRDELRRRFSEAGSARAS
ncbi:MAG: YkoP family protein [Caulobacteraceae bacterium]